MTIKQMKKWIDEASYEELLRKWRFALAGDPFFKCNTGMSDYYLRVMEEKKQSVNAVAISKRVGW